MKNLRRPVSSTWPLKHDHGNWTEDRRREKPDNHQQRRDSEQKWRRGCFHSSFEADSRGGKSPSCFHSTPASPRSDTSASRNSSAASSAPFVGQVFIEKLHSEVSCDFFLFNFSINRCKSVKKHFYAKACLLVFF